MTVIRLISATLFPGIFAVLIYSAEKKTKFSRLSYPVKQTVIGVIFGIVAILATEFGIPVDGAVLNVRTGAPLTAGLLFGGPAGIIAGIIGGVERWFSVAWGGGAYTRLACTLATVMAGFFAAAMRRFMFDNKKASPTAGFAIGLTTEVMHMLLVFLTNMSDIHTAFAVVEKCAPLMISLNALSVAISMDAVKLLGRENKEKRKEQKQISQIYRSGLMLCVILAFCASCVFTTILQTQISGENSDSVLTLAIDEVPRNIENITENTFVTYAGWITDDIMTAENPGNEYLAGLAKTFAVPEIFLVNADGSIFAGNIAPGIVSAVPESYVISDGKTGGVCSYGKSFINPALNMQYAAVRLNDSSFVLVGYGEEFVTGAIRKKIDLIAVNQHIGQDGYLLICDESGIVVSSADGSTGNALSSMGINTDGVSENTVLRTSVNEVPVRMMTRQIETPAGYYTVIAVLPESEAVFARNTSVYIMAFMEILVFAALFINVYFLTKRVVVDNIHKVNESLAKITGGNLNEKVDVRENEEFASLTDDINSTVSTLKHYISEAAARIDKELEFAKAIQHSSLPSVFPPYPNRKDFAIYALMDTAKEVGGDFYDFYLLDNNRLGFLIADVSGKGIPAAMFMMTAKSVIKGLAESGLSANEIFTQANSALCDGNDTGMFVTAWIGILELDTGKLSFANAGHNPPLIRHKNGSFEYLRTRPNFILAGLKSTQYKLSELQLSPGDEIFLYTDGVTEAKNSENQMFREETLLEMINRNPDEGVEMRCKNLLKGINLFVGGAEQFDDITMLSVRLNHLQTSDSIIVYPELNSTDAVWDFLDSKIKKSGLPGKLGTKLRICTDEIYSNILRYSHATVAEIHCRIEDNVLTLVFSDDGIPYDPTLTAAPDITLSAGERELGGLGIFMVKKTVRELSYEYKDNRNVQTLTFDI